MGRGCDQVASPAGLREGVPGRGRARCGARVPSGRLSTQVMGGREREASSRPSAGTLEVKRPRQRVSPTAHGHRAPLRSSQNTSFRITRPWVGGLGSGDGAPWRRRTLHPHLPGEGAQALVPPGRVPGRSSLSIPEEAGSCGQTTSDVPLTLADLVRPLLWCHHCPVRRDLEARLPLPGGQTASDLLQERLHFTCLTDLEVPGAGAGGGHRWELSLWCWAGGHTPRALGGAGHGRPLGRGPPGPRWGSGRLTACDIAFGTSGLKKHTCILSLKNKHLMRTRRALVTGLPPEPAPPGLSGGPAVPSSSHLDSRALPPPGAVGCAVWSLPPGSRVGRAPPLPGVLPAWGGGDADMHPDPVRPAGKLRQWGRGRPSAC